MKVKAVAPMMAVSVATDEMQLLTWVTPQRVAEVSFAEWTRDGSLRHAAFIGLRNDKRPRDVHNE